MLTRYRIDLGDLGLSGCVGTFDISTNVICSMHTAHISYLCRVNARCQKHRSQNKKTSASAGNINVIYYIREKRTIYTVGGT